MEGKRKVGIPVRINDFCTKVGVDVCSAGLEDSQALNLDPQRSGRGTEEDVEYWMVKRFQCQIE